MPTSNIRRGVIAGFGLMLIVLFGNGVVIQRELGVQVANQDWVVHAQQVRFKLSEVASLLKDAETGQRGFLYTEDPKYLSDYQLAISQVQPEIDNVAQLIEDDQGEQTKLKQLRELASLKLSELAQTILLYQSGNPEKAKALVKSDHGLIVMKKIRRLMADMGQAETSVEERRALTYRKSIQITVACVYGATLIAVIGLASLCFSILRQFDARERHTRQIAERDEWFRDTLTSLGDAVMATDEQGTVSFLNTVAEELIGMASSAAKGKQIEAVLQIFNETTLQAVPNPINRVLQSGRIVGLANHTILKRMDGTMIPIEDSAAPIRDAEDRISGVVLVFRDATAERRSQELLRKTEKLSTAARLASTVAHEINNPLEAISNLIYIVSSTSNLPASAYEHLALAEQELERISHITRQTLGFYRESGLPEQIEIASLIDSILKVLANKLKSKNIVIERDLQECPPMRGLAGELKQVIANLITNAADAVDIGGTIRIGLICLKSDGRQVAELSVTDDGPGIPPDLRERIFEPFFTTKKDVGTGLGLWVTKEIVERHDGVIEVESRHEKGTSGATFRVILPLTREEAASGM